jgi:L-seryl-tRNA(Ser) seleniumtransferase
VIVRDHEVEHGYFYLDPCNLHPGEAELVADQVVRTAAAIRGRPAPDVQALHRKQVEALLRWPD